MAVRARSVGRPSASAAAPSRKPARNARYQAIIGGTVKSAALKLRRVATLGAVSVQGNVVTLTGKIDRSKLKRGAKLKVAARGGRGLTACSGGGTKLKLAGKAKVSRSGKFTVKVAVSGTGRTAVRLVFGGAVKTATLYGLK